MKNILQNKENGTGSVGRGILKWNVRYTEILDKVYEIREMEMLVMGSEVKKISVRDCVIFDIEC